MTIAGRPIPHDLPPALHDELTELRDLSRTYQQRDQPDYGLLADLHTRKARAFEAWAEATGDKTLTLDAQRAEKAAETARFQHEKHTGVARVLNTPAQWEHARSVLARVADQAPLPGPETRLLVLLLTLRAAHTGTANLTGQDITALALPDPEDLLERLTSLGWLSIPGTAHDLLAARPESPVRVRVPTLLPHTDGTQPVTFGRKVRPKLSGWAQKIITDKRLRKAKAGPGARLLALTLATQADTAGRLGPGGTGIVRSTLTTQIPADPDNLRHFVDQMTAAGWLNNAELTDGDLTGQLTEYVLPLTCPIP